MRAIEVQRPEVVIIAYGAPELLAGTLDALGPGFAITIVDNSSNPATRELAGSWRATYLDPGANLGFGAGVNLALDSLAERGLADRDVLLLNPDARIAAAEVEKMIAVLHPAPRIAAVGATQTDPDTGDPIRVWWPFPHPARAWLESREGLGLSVIEAMAPGLPVVPSDAGGHRETVGAVPDAPMFPVGDAAAAGRQIAAPCDDPARRTAYGQSLQARQREQTLAVYESIR